jgi:predicted esterase
MDCVYLNAPHVSRCAPGIELFSEGPYYTWNDRSKALEDQEDMWEEDMQYLAKYLKKHGPFVGVFAFSQGAAIVTNFSHPKIWRDKFKMSSCPWKVAILACGASSYRITLPKGLTIDVPSFHMFGKKDKFLTDSKTVAEYWNHTLKVTHTHSRGHEIDTMMFNREKEMMAKLEKFLDKHVPEEKGAFAAMSAALHSIPVPEFHLLGHTFGGRSSDSGN